MIVISFYSQISNFKNYFVKGKLVSKLEMIKLIQKSTYIQDWWYNNKYIAKILSSQKCWNRYLKKYQNDNFMKPN